MRTIISPSGSLTPKEEHVTEEELMAELTKDPFVPFRLHLVSGKVVDVLAPNAAHPLANSLLVLRNPTIGTPKAEGYDVVAYQNIERIEQLQLGKRPGSKRRPAS
jgi:hypothetical protein